MNSVSSKFGVFNAPYSHLVAPPYSLFGSTLSSWSERVNCSLGTGMCQPPPSFLRGTPVTLLRLIPFQFNFKHYSQCTAVLGGWTVAPAALLCILLQGCSLFPESVVGGVGCTFRSLIRLFFNGIPTDYSTFLPLLHPSYQQALWQAEGMRQPNLDSAR